MSRLSNTVVNAQADELARLLDDGYLRIYNGSRPATTDDPVTSQTLLAELRVSNPSAPAAIDGVLSVTLLSDIDANASGSATWYRLLASNGITPLLDGTVGTNLSYDLTFNSTSIQIHAQIDVTGYTHTVPKGS